MKYNRRTFLKAGFLSSVVLVMDGCNLFSVTTSRETIKSVQYDLFPKAKDLNINTADYIDLILHHSRVTQKDKIFLKNGVKWLNEAAVELYQTMYAELRPSQRQAVLQTIVKTQWGESWIYNMQTYIFEAMFGDPIYGGNNNEAGWKWLAFEGGLPRPTKAFL